jgi:predicted DNA-binding transcriptional regulator AlpA
MSILIRKNNQQAAVASRECVRARNSDLAEVFRRLERDLEQASAKPQVKIVKRHEAAAMLGVSTRTLQRWHKQGFGPARSTGRRFYYIKSEIEQWIASHGRGRKRSDLTERSPMNTNSNPDDKPGAIDCTKVDTPKTFTAPEDANSTPCGKSPAANCT